MRLIYGFLSVLLLSCSSNKEVIDANSTALRFEKTACYGTCPEFVLTVKHSGVATLEVKANMDLAAGTYNCSNCDKLQLKLILDKAEKIDFSDFDAVYDPGVTDLPAVITTINDTKVTHIMDGPASLKELEEQINDAYIKNRVWKKVSE